jgi:hypothetical protein
MLVVFCLRLAVGLVAALLLLSPAQVNPRFYRTHFLIVLALAAGGLVFAWEFAGTWLLLALGVALAGAFLGSLAWSLEGAPGGRALVVLTLLGLAPALALVELHAVPEAKEPAWLLVSGFTSAALLGAALTAMLMGHSYLIAPAMSLTPLLTLLAAGGAAVLARVAVSAAGLWSWTGGHSLFTLEEETVLWLLVRWGVGFAGALIMGWMAWQSARIRSTQSATGILYVVVIFCFLGELTSQLLLGSTGYAL